MKKTFRKAANLLISLVVSITMLFPGIQPSSVSAQAQTQTGLQAETVNIPQAEAFGVFWYVSTTGNDANDCTTPATPCATLNTVISKTNSGDTIYVANGRYIKLINNYSSSFVVIDKSLTIIGGWDSTFSAQNGLSIIDGEKKYVGVINIAPNATLSNFIITNSYTGLENELGGFLTLDRVSIINSVIMGVYNSSANMVIKNTTISKNGAGGIINASGNISIFNSTIANNISTGITSYGGGIFNSYGTTIITNSVVANNSAPQAPDCYNQEYGGGSLISNGYNILGSTTGCTITAAAGDKFDINPMLSPLLPSGYQALAPSGPAINAGNPVTCLQKDQRGTDRLADAKCDIGAYEYIVPGAATELFVVNPEIMHAPVNSSFLRPLQVVALDATGSPVGGVNINFSAPNTEPTGKFSDTNSNITTAITDPVGLATSSTLIAGSQIGNFVVNVTAPGISSLVTFNLHNGTWLVSPTGLNTNSCLDVDATCSSVFGVLEKTEFMPGETIWLSLGVYPWPGSTANGINKDVNIEGGWSPTFDSIQGVSEINGGWFLISYPNIANVKVTRIDFNDGARIENNGNLVIKNSSIRNKDQAIWNTGYGTLTLNNVTVSGNGNFSAAIRNQGILTLANTTISGNQGFTTGGIENESRYGLFKKNSIIAGNIASNYVDYASIDCRGAFVSLGNNIIGTMGSESYTGFYDCYGSWSATDILGSDISPIPVSEILIPTIQQDISSGEWVHPLMLGSIAMDSGASCLATDQRGVTRPQGLYCDIGAYEFDMPPVVQSITRASVNPTNLSSVDFTVTFSESVTGVDVSDFSLTTNGVSGATVSGVSGSGSVYTVTVNTGSGDGTIRMDVVDDNSIVDGASNPLGGAVVGDGNFTTGQVYIVNKSSVFADVPLVYWANTSIERLYNAGITGGCTTVPLSYCPITPVTRAQMAIFLLRGMHGSAYTPPAATGTKFNDVPLGTFGAAWIEQLAVEGITSGCGGGNYCPTTPVSRAHMAIFLVRAKHGIAFTPPTATGLFTDVPVGSFGADYIEQLSADAITSGCGGTNYCPNTTVKRDSMAVFLVKTFNLP